MKKTTQRKKERSKYQRKFMTLLLVITLSFPVNVLQAKTTYSMSDTSLVLIKGNTKKIKLVNAPADAKINWSTSNKFAAAVDKGVVTALNYGTAKITATYKKKTYTCSVTIPDTSKKITPNVYSVSLVEGKNFQLTTVSANVVHYHSQNESIATVNEKGLIIGKNPGKTKIILKSNGASAECTVTVVADKSNVEPVKNGVSKRKTAIRRVTKKNNIRYERIVWAKNKEIRFKIANLDEGSIKKCVWYTSDKKVLARPKKIKGNKIAAEARTVESGRAKVIAKVTYKNGRVKEYSTRVYVSSPLINTKNLIVLGKNAGSWRLQYITFSGLSKYSVVKWDTSSAPDIRTTSYRNKLAILGNTPSSGIIKAHVDGKTYKVKYTVLNPTFHKLTGYIVKGKSAKINIEGIGMVQPQYSGRSENIATVAQDGTVWGKGPGVTIVDAKIGNYSFGFRVEVAARGMKKIIERADYIVNNWKYSQSKRMKDGFYDCSSLVWKGYKVYKEYQEKLGSRTQAYCAADLFDYLKGKNQIVYFGYLGYDYLKPGDLIFYGDYDSAVQYSTPGRTLNIYHVAMYAGNARVVEKGGQPINYNNLDHVVGIGRVIN
ncbi:MAG: hypothetical protein HFG28_02545 [Eubacterium sp.]|nr:hypothetical protein [Eubacterium sp.]